MLTPGEIYSLVLESFPSWGQENLIWMHTVGKLFVFIVTQYRPLPPAELAATIRKIKFKNNVFDFPENKTFLNSVNLS